MRWILAAVLVGGTLAPAAAQQSPCGKHEEMTAMLARKYQEHQVNAGITAAGSMLEVFVSVKGSWTLLETKPLPGSLSCMVEGGTSWDKPPGKGV